MKMERTSESSREISAIGNTDNARNTIKKLGMDITLNATMPGIPGCYQYKEGFLIKTR